MFYYMSLSDGKHPRTPYSFMTTSPGNVPDGQTLCLLFLPFPVALSPHHHQLFHRNSWTPCRSNADDEVRFVRLLIQLVHVLRDGSHVEICYFALHRTFSIGHLHLTQVVVTCILELQRLVRVSLL